MNIAEKIYTQESAGYNCIGSASLPIAQSVQPIINSNNIESVCEPGHPLGLLLFSIHHQFALERAYGEGMRDHVFNIIREALKEGYNNFLADAESVFTEQLDDGGIITIFRRDDIELQYLADLAMTFRLSMRRAVNKEIVQLTGQRLDIKTGYARIHRREGVSMAHTLYQALCDAREVASGAFNISKLRLMDEFRQIIDMPRLSTVFQPIVDLKSNRILGWEALARGPEESRFHSPAVLFGFAEEVGSLFSLERACRTQAIQSVGNLSKDQKIFLNIHPHTVGDPQFTAGQTKRLLEESGLKPENVVFEITERHPIRDFTLFFRTLDHYRSQGYQVAIDDVGAGYSGLWTLGQLRPEYIKVDMSLIRNVDANPANRALVEILVEFANKMGSRVIAEGIETETELSSLMDMGVHFGQGFFLARPGRPKPQPVRVMPIKKPIIPKELIGAGRCSIPIGELAEPALVLPSNVKISDAQALLDAAPPSPIAGVVVVRDNKPLGVVMSYDLNKQLGTLYGIALYFERPITKLMDPNPLIFEEDVPVEIVAEKAMSREKYKVYDHILVTRNEELLGVVSVRKMLDTLARVQVEMAKGANPLTGLPGNVAIEQDIENRAKLNQHISLIYADLDNFKVYNDKYGFEAGDKMILLCSKVLGWAARRHGGSEAYVGHVGGDDFVVITSPEKSERVARSVVRVFKRLAPAFYTEEDRRNGYIEGKDRTGGVRRFGLTSVSLAIVDCQGQYDIIQIAQRAAEMKKYAKSKPGNSYVRDRRQPIGISC